MNKFLDRLLGRDSGSANQAKERMKLVLIHDRTDLSQKQMDILKDELIQVISPHIEIDPAAVNIQMAHEGREQRLIADIPIAQAQRRRIR